MRLRNLDRRIGLRPALPRQARRLLSRQAERLLSGQAQRLSRAVRSDRGDSPVPTAIIIVGLALLAVGVLAMASNAIDSWELLIPPASAP